MLNWNTSQCSSRTKPVGRLAQRLLETLQEQSQQNCANNTSPRKRVPNQNKMYNRQALIMSEDRRNNSRRDIKVVSNNNNTAGHYMSCNLNSSKT